MIATMLNTADDRTLRTLSNDEVDAVSGAKVIEIGIGPITFQYNTVGGCWAVWVGKELAGGGCPK